MNAPDSHAHPDRDRNAQGRPENARPRDRFGAPLPRDAADELGERVEPDDICTSVAQAVETAAELFGQQRFFEAHEFFEWAWKGPVTNDADRVFFKGMAQLAVGYTHTQRGNETGARSLLQRGIDHIRPFGPRHLGVDVQRAVSQAESFLKVLDDHEASPDLTFPAFPADVTRRPGE
ncbi:MAG: DUF309 domain-containing protein [Euzebya sp.]